jgi:DNA modification methylase
VEHLTEAQKKAYILADNRLALDAGWDMDILRVELEELKEINFDIDLTGFNSDELSDIFGEEELEAVEDDYEVELPEEPKTKLGDIYQLGRHRLMCGDSTDRQCVELLMDGARADIAFSSPPYNAGTTATETAMNKTTKYNGNDDNKSESDYIEFLNSYIERAMEYSEYVFMNVQSISNNKIALIDVLYHNKDIYADTIVWDKTHGQPAMAENVMNSVFEYVHVFSEKANRAIGTIPFRGTVDNIFHLQPQRNNAYSAIHNATFSVEFASHFIKTFAKESVLDQFGGTGTTLIACEQLNRTCYCMELDTKYCDVIIDRWEVLTGEKAVKQ